MPLADALDAEGVDVWRDEREIADGDSITEEIARGLAESRAMVCLFSRTYLTRPSCRWELVAALSRGGPERVVVVNPDSGDDHIRPAGVADAARPVLRARDPAALAETARRIRARLETLAGSIGPGALDRPDWRPSYRLEFPRFVGRTDEQLRIHHALHAVDVAATSHAAGAPVAVLTGLPGSGKTLLAAEYARRFGAAYPGGVFWLDAEGDGDAGPGERLARQLRLMLKSPDDEIEDRCDVAGMKDRLSVKLGGADHLWIVDALPASISDDAARDWVAPSPRGRTIVTTQAAGRWAGEPIRVGPLSPAESRELLSRHRAAWDDEEAAAADDLAALLDHHPLGVDLAGGVLAASPRLGYAAFCARLHVERDEALSRRVRAMGGPDRDALEATQAMIRRSVDLLDEPARELLALGAMLAPATIPGALLDDVGARVAGDGEIWSLAASAEPGRVGLAAIDEAGGVRVHAMVREIAGDVVPTERARALRAAAAAALQRSLERHLLPAAGDPSLADALHAERLVLESFADVPTGLALVVADHALERGWYWTARRVLEVARRGGGDDRPDVDEPFGFMRRLGGALRGEHELDLAQAVHRWVVEALSGEAGDASPRARSLAQAELAATLHELGETAEALALFEEAHYWFAEHADPADGQRLACAEHLGNALLAQGSTDEARRLLEDVLALRTEWRGTTHPDVLRARMHLALGLAESDAARAYKLLREVETAVDGLGPTHPTALALGTNLAVLEASFGDPTAALARQERVVDALSELVGPLHPPAIRGRANAAMMLAGRGDVESLREACARQRAVVADAREAVGPGSQEAVAAALNLSLWLTELADRGAETGHLDEAETLAHEALGAAAAALGDDHTLALAAREQIAEVHRVRALRDGTSAGVDGHEAR